MANPLGIITAPFTEAQVTRLNEWQKNKKVHPFTCGQCRDADPEFPLRDQHELVATEDGWICPTCDYTQDWAHDFMAKEGAADDA
mgnify:CR=1 FL=1